MQVQEQSLSFGTVWIEMKLVKESVEALEVTVLRDGVD